MSLFIDNNENVQKYKWGLWVIHKLLLTGVYGMIFSMYNSSWRERLPGKLLHQTLTSSLAHNCLSLVAYCFSSFVSS